MNLLDHWLLFVLVVLLPLEGRAEMGALRAAARGGDRGARLRTLVGTVVVQWALVLLLLASWATAGRPLAGLGLIVPGGRKAICGLAGIGATAWLVWLQYHGVSRLAPERRARLRERSGDSILLLPFTGAERIAFAATACTAGICEELLCRGFVFWYLGHWMNPWVTLFVASVPFGVVHIYQGRAGAIRTGMVALVLGFFYLLTGSLLWPMLMHASIDLGGGLLGRFLAAPIEVAGAADGGRGLPQPQG